jgi:5-methylcytosine-specific restriction protein B
MLPELYALREEFNRRFPKEKIMEMTLDDYAQGTANTNSFSNWVEGKTHRLGRLGGFPAKFGVYYHRNKGWQFNKKYRNPQDALDNIKIGLSKLIQACEKGHFDDLDKIGIEEMGRSRYGLRIKPLALYFPNDILAIFSKPHLESFLRSFDLTVHEDDDVFAYNRQLLKFLRTQSKFDEFDNHQMMQFLYDCLSPKPEREADTKPRIWKIAPGEGAEFWEMCREQEYIAIGWLENADFRKFKNKGDLKTALIEAGQGTGASSQIWNFTRSHLINKI